MAELAPEDRAAIVEDVMRRKFGHLLEWARSKPIHTFGPNDLDSVEKYEAKLEATKKQVREALSRWSDEKLMNLGARLKVGSSIEDNEWQALGGPAINEISQSLPPPIAYGFGHPSFKADFDYWGKMPKLTIHEALVLSVGADPSAFPEDRIKAVKEMQSKGGKPWTALSFLVKRLEIFRRHFRNTGWGYVSETPPELKAWIDRIELPVHPDFYAELSKRSPETKAAVSPAAPPNLARQERETLLKLIAAMACEQYNFDPRKERSEATSRILEDIELVGLSMDAKTIRKWLNEAGKMVDPNYWSKSG